VIKRPNLRIHEIEKELIYKLKSPKTYSMKLQQKIFPYLEKEMDIQVQESSRTPNRHEHQKTILCHIVKMPKVQKN
jgi:hypothetical protein